MVFGAKLFRYGREQVKTDGYITYEKFQVDVTWFNFTKKLRMERH